MATDSRQPRSRLDRPCDACRRYKHMCILPVRGEPCLSCKARTKPCTYNVPPTVRKRRKEATADAKTGPVSASSQAWTPSFEGPGITSSTSWNTSSGGPSTSSHNMHAPNGRSAKTPISPPDTESFNLNNGAKQAVNSAPSLDLDPDVEQESHFLGALALASFACGQSNMPTSVASPGGLSFRQVSADPATPVFFFKSPSLMYGRTQTTGKKAYDAVCDLCSGLGHDIPSRALMKLQRNTLPAIPFVNFKRLEASCLGLENSGPVPYALLAGIIAHTTHYIPELRPLHKQLWREALCGLDDEYRLPRLATLQLALMQLFSRPMEYGENAGQLEIALARATGAAHLLGLHMDPSSWSLPHWERTLRKRIWWALLIQNKWRALIYGRPSTVHQNDYRVALPSVEDGDWEQHGSASDRISMESFVATCRLTQIVDRLLDSFYTVKAIHEPITPIARLAVLEGVLADLDGFEASLPLALRRIPSEDRVITTVPTGVRSMRLSILGLRVLVHRLLFDTAPTSSSWQTSSILNSAYDACRAVINLTNSLTPSDQEMYWAPYSSHHFTNTMSLLLHMISRARNTECGISVYSVNATIDLAQALTQAYSVDRWDVAGLSLRHMATLMTMVEKDIPETAEGYRIIALTLGLPLHGHGDAVSDPLATLLMQDIDSGVWLNKDVSWLSELGTFLNQGDPATGPSLFDMEFQQGVA